jgi:hypothetical protein
MTKIKVGLEKHIHHVPQVAIIEIELELEAKAPRDLKTKDIEIACHDKHPGWRVTGWMILH